MKTLKTAKNQIIDTRRAARSGLVVALGLAYVLAGTFASVGNTSLFTGLGSSVRRLNADRRDRGALSLEQAIVTAVLSAAAIALGVVIVNAVVNHQNQIK